ncbi:tRNA (guanosine(46)-N7)-methyltransferase TrmB [Penaeicola halotolerans]|uniref:tRNA (guanosine(46)-N7)-methyltransferase TrmB n=1 Tax=Penaeicola halotolerans TaxID=2793196 RepID=UPI001CF8E948|nr:tRNA (guanosine(46)-N7)-methyltransferase TrmB [Penaeicola halotolerans]
MRKKLSRFQDNEVNPNVIQEGKPVFETIKGNWQKDHFNNSKPLVVELACGRGEYTVGLARVYPHKNFIGVDIKGARIWVGSKQAMNEGLQNVAFLRTQIQMIDRFFATGEVSELWLTFPDPRPRDGDEKRRLTHPRFLDMYKDMLSKDGIFHLKTDSTSLFDYTLEVLEQREDILDLIYTKDLYQSPYNNDHHGIKTKYEQIFYDKGESIKYLRFKFAT